MPSLEVLDPFSVLSLAANVVQLAGIAAKLSMNATNIYQDVRNAPREFLTFSRRIMQYSKLLLVVAEIIQQLMPAGNLQSAAEEMLSDSQRALGEAAHVMEKNTPS